MNDIVFISLKSWDDLEIGYKKPFCFFLLLGYLGGRADMYLFFYVCVCVCFLITCDLPYLTKIGDFLIYIVKDSEGSLTDASKQNSEEATLV